MNARPNFIIDVLRSEGTDPEGEPVDDDAAPAVLTGIPASIITRNRQVTDPASGRPSTVRWFIGRVPAGTDIQSSDRIRTADGQIYAVDSVDPGTSLGRTNDLRLELRRL